MLGPFVSIVVTEAFAQKANKPKDYRVLVSNKTFFFFNFSSINLSSNGLLPAEWGGVPISLWSLLSFPGFHPTICTNKQCTREKKKFKLKKTILPYCGASCVSIRETCIKNFAKIPPLTIYDFVQRETARKRGNAWYRMMKTNFGRLWQTEPH